MNLEVNSELRQACIDSEKAALLTDWYEDWGARLCALLEYVRAADREVRASLEFHQRIWEEESVSSTGQGHINVQHAIEDESFRSWPADNSLGATPESSEARLASHRALYDGVLERLSKFTKRMPRLKLFRVLAVFFPNDFTTIADGQSLRKLHKAMGLPAASHPVELHSNVLRRLDDAVGPVNGSLDALVDRVRLPWLLYLYYVKQSENEPTDIAVGLPGTEKLKPLPATRRRRGLTGISGGLESIVNILEFSREGVSREDLKDHLRTLAPHLKDSSLNTQVNVLISEYNVIHNDGDIYRLTERGETLLESGDPDDLADWLITRILGPDHVLVRLRDARLADTNTLVEMLQQVNPGWTSTYAPTMLLSCLRQFELIARGEASHYLLTESGRRWANLIDWEPESLPRKEEDEDLGSKEIFVSDPRVVVARPELSVIKARIASKGHFTDQQISRLHRGLWSHKRRHFAVLTGLSGSGKTLLAIAYAHSLAETTEAVRKRTLVVPVQPGWYDPSALLGYVNPLQTSTYVRTPFLEFLILAANEPRFPFTLILDELNLSRPEQYLAPILSAMETPGESIQLHSEAEILDGVPATVPYPNNLVIVGTVNMDETTHGLSDKVLDRAFTLEFWDIDLSKYPSWDDWNLPETVKALARSVLEQLMQALRPARMHFGWRTVDDVMGYLSAVRQETDQSNAVEDLDSVVYAKVLPKLRGDDSPAFRDALDGCSKVLGVNGLSDSSRKIDELRRDLAATGTARFWR